MRSGFIKIGEAVEISPADIQDFNSVSPLISEDIILEFKKTASQLKKIAPKAEDFLYFSAVMMHAAEAVSINEDGSPKLNVRGDQIKVSWDKSGGTWRWKSSDPSVKPYKNSNGDIFPEEELIRAHKKWIGKPLCIDHKSSSVDHVRGFIVDTYYDRKLKRVIALCALDKHNYPDLARKVSTGYSNSVSMGTAVGKAICYDCATVAKTEADFCKCMKNKSCYGEINIDLNPIELSIVVNGADPQAKIKHIIAAANSLNAYVDQKEQELQKLAEVMYSANVTVCDTSKDPNDSSYSQSHSISSSNFEELRKGIEDAVKSLEEFNAQATSAKTLSDESEEHEESEDLKDTDENAENESEDSQDHEDSKGGLKSASSRDFHLTAIELDLTLDAIKRKLAHIKENLTNLSNTFSQKSNQKEEIMSGTRNDNLNKRGYFQGGGGVNEPTPGQAKYEKDPLNEELREGGDRQMVGHSPFPDVGSVDGLYPGVSKSDLETKKMLARAQAEERAAKRAELVSKAKEALNKKQAYFQGGGEGNEPTPGKRKYTPDPMNEDLRADDKHMVGQKPFPEVGRMDGLHPSPESASERDELKRKQMLSRAGYTAKFIKAANVDGSHNPANSLWQVYNQDGSLVFSASVGELSGGKAIALYAGIATESFGKDLIKKVRSFGAEQTKSLYKLAQPAPAAPAEAAPAAPAPEAGAAPAEAAPAAPAPEAGAAPAEPAPEDTGKNGDPKEVVKDLAQKISTLASDLIEAVRVLTGEQAEMGDLAELAGSEGGDKVTTASLQKMRKELNGALISAMKESIATLRDHESELKTITSIYKKSSLNESNRDMVDSLVDDAVVDAKEAVADAFKLLEAFVKYARGTEAIVKRAQEEGMFDNDLDLGSVEYFNLDDLRDLSDGDDGGDDIDVDSILNEEMLDDDDLLNAEDDGENGDVFEAHDHEAHEDENDAKFEAKSPQAAKELAGVVGPDDTISVSAGLNSKAARAAYRAKLAAELKFNPVLEDSAKHVEKTKGELGDVETVEQVHEKMMDVATAPAKVRKEAEAIQKLVAEGKITPSDFPALIANGLDEEAVKYWKQFFGEAGPEGSEFANELVKEHAKAQLEEQMGAYRVKLARAYELAYEMLDRGLVARDRGALSSQVEEVMKWNDESFESVKRLVAKHSATSMTKQAGRIPQVGVFGAESALPTGGSEDFESQLAAAFSKSGKRFF